MARLMIVDDEPDVCESFATALGAAGYAVQTCSNGDDAIELYRNEGADLVFCDMKLPGMDGMAVLGAVKAIDPWATVIVVTAYGNVEMATHALRRGAYDFVEKPCTVAQIQQVTRRALSYRRQLQQIVSLQGKPGVATDIPTRLVEVEQMKSDFLTMMLQDLRKPLRLLSDGICLVRNGFYGVWSATQQQFLNQCAQVERHLSRLILGSFALFLSQEHRVRASPGDMRRVIERVLQ